MYVMRRGGGEGEGGGTRLAYKSSSNFFSRARSAMVDFLCFLQQKRTKEPTTGTGNEKRRTEKV